MDKTIKLGKTITYVITAGVVILLVGRIFYFFSESSSFFARRRPKLAAIILGLLAGGSVFKSAGFFEERTGRNMIRYVGIALTLRTASYAAEYLPIGIPRLIVYALAVGSEILALCGCVSHLRKIATDRKA